MPGGNFDDVLTITDGRIQPAGPLARPKPGIKPETEGAQVEVYAWVVQAKADGTGAFLQVEGASDADDPGRWTTATTGNKAVLKGEFTPGPALAMAVAILTPKSGKPSTDFWSEMISLDAEKQASQS